MSNNVALNKPATASNFVLPYVPAKAVDGNITSAASRWICSQLPGWMCLDLGDFYWINHYIVRNLGCLGWPSPGSNIKSFKLQSSLDNLNWIDRDIITNNTANIVERNIRVFKARYVNLYITEGMNYNPGIGAITELELYDTPTTSNFLTNLSVSSGVLTPPFSKNILNYSVSLNYDTAGITLTPTSEDSAAIITVNSNPVPSGQPSPLIGLGVGDNSIKVEVFPSIGDPQTYQVNAQRGSSPYLSNLVVKSGRSSFNLNPTFANKTLSYTANVGAGIVSVNIIPTAEDPSATILVNNKSVQSGQPSDAINVYTGDNPINIQVKSSKGNQLVSYSINVIKASQ